MKTTDSVLVGSERVTQLLIELPENGMTPELGLIQEFLVFDRDRAFMESLDEDLRRAVRTRAENIRSHLKRLNVLRALMANGHIQRDGSYKSLRLRDTFLALAEDEAFLRALPYNLYLEAYHRAFMLRSVSPRQQCCAA